MVKPGASPRPHSLSAMFDETPSLILDDAPKAGDSVSPQPPPEPDDGTLLDAYSRAVIHVVDRLGPTVRRPDRWKERKPRRAASGSRVIGAPDGVVLASS